MTFFVAENVQEETQADYISHGWDIGSELTLGTNEASDWEENRYTLFSLSLQQSPGIWGK